MHQFLSLTTRKRPWIMGLYLSVFERQIRVLNELDLEVIKFLSRSRIRNVSLLNQCKLNSLMLYFSFTDSCWCYLQLSQCDHSTQNSAQWNFVCSWLCDSSRKDSIFWVMGGHSIWVTDYLHGTPGWDLPADGWGEEGRSSEKCKESFIMGNFSLKCNYGHKYATNPELGQKNC